MLESLFALGSAASFGIATILTWHGVLRVSSNYIANLTILIGFAFFLIVCTLTGDTFQVFRYTWQALLFFAISGIMHFALGRTLSYQSIRLIGGTRSNMVTNQNIIVTAVLAVIFLADPINLRIIVGILISISGPLLMAFKENVVSGRSRGKEGTEAYKENRRSVINGTLLAACTAVLWGSSAVFIKLGLANGGSSLGGAVIGYAAAMVFIIPSLINRNSVKEFRSVDRKTFHVALWVGITTSLAQMFRYLALAKGSLILTTMLFRTGPVWVLLFAFFMNRKAENFTRWVLIGNGLLLAGIIITEL